MKVYIGIDNGVSGSVGIITETAYHLHKTPVRRVLNYTKTKQFLNRIDGVELETLLVPYCVHDCMCYIERPMINPSRFKATISAIRALEATLIVLEMLKIPYVYLDSKEWQKSLLPSGLEGFELKVASLQVGMRLFPQLDWKKFDDGDGILISEYARRNRN